MNILSDFDKVHGLLESIPSFGILAFDCRQAFKHSFRKTWFKNVDIGVTAPFFLLFKDYLNVTDN